MAFVPQKPALKLEPAAGPVTGEPAESTDTNHTMAGHHDREGIGSASPAHGSGTGPEPSRKRTVRHRLARRDGPQRLPDPALKRRTAKIKQQVEAPKTVLEVGVQRLFDRRR